uniref:Uncharacterized protein n=1 Tax=Laticauda laticaudata TaxID=8630 RepID=A0A8C5WT58_LATLA
MFYSWSWITSALPTFTSQTEIREKNGSEYYQVIMHIGFYWRTITFNCSWRMNCSYPFLQLRRAALKHLLSIEHLQYQLEFNHLGMSFYVERL